MSDSISSIDRRPACAVHHPPRHVRVSMQFPAQPALHNHNQHMHALYSMYRANTLKSVSDGPRPNWLERFCPPLPTTATELTCFWPTLAEYKPVGACRPSSSRHHGIAWQCNVHVCPAGPHSCPAAAVCSVEQQAYILPPGRCVCCHKHACTWLACVCGLTD